MKCTLVIFGASGDLTSRKLIPALYRLHHKGRLPEGLRIVGFARTPLGHDAWRDALRRGVAEAEGDALSAADWSALAASIYYHAGDVDNSEDIAALGRFLDELEGADGRATRVYYLATAPRFFESTVRHLGASGMVDSEHFGSRVVVEKPFGTNRQSARRLNDVLHCIFAEDRIYRIDHYLGKETVQNILVLRFGNTIFEPVWNRNYIDHVQITAAEDVTIGRRGGYYDLAGVLRDMFQNHLLQLLAVTAMEAPSRFTADAVRSEKVKVLGSIRPVLLKDAATCSVRGQYRGYGQEPGVATESRTATFAALRLSIDNWRWQGVPFYLRSGKAMDCRTTQIVIQFRRPPHLMFEIEREKFFEANRLLIQIQPAEGIQLHFQTKVPDAGMKMQLTDLEFRFARHFRGLMPDAYERLLLDVLAGDLSLFPRSDEVDLAWSIIDPIVSAWEQSDQPPLAIYEPGMWGPDESNRWIARDDRRWFDVCPVLK